MTAKQQPKTLIPTRLRNIYIDWVSKNPDFESLCKELELSANSYAELFHKDAARRGLLKKSEILTKMTLDTKNTQKMLLEFGGKNDV